MALQQSMQGVKSEDTRKCPECGSSDLSRGSKEIYCKKCGYVID